MNMNDISRLGFVEKLFSFPSIDSTNTFAQQLDSFPQTGISVVVAGRQTMGRGQRGNSFFSGEGGLYASIVCPISDITLHFSCNRAISLAIYDAVKARCPGAPLFIKWPNDIFWSHKKLCGILLESLARSSSHLVVGFGINVNTAADAFPPFINNATSMMMETGKIFDIPDLLGAICRLFQQYRSMSVPKAHKRYCRRLYRRGSLVCINGQRGIFETVYEDGRLGLNIGREVNAVSSGPMEFVD